MTSALLVADGLNKVYDRRGAPAIHAVRDLSFRLSPGECLAVVGESGSGKSTLAKMAGALLQPTSGSVVVNGVDMFGLSRAELRRSRREFQFVFQDPKASLNRRRTVGQILQGALQRSGADSDPGRPGLVDLIHLVGLTSDILERYPHEISGGQAQRVSIARAVAPRPSLLILDEPVSALDLSVQAQILNLLKDLQDEFRLGYLFISHDLAVVRFLADRILVMKEGLVVESGSRDDVFSRPEHQYTQLLLEMARRRGRSEGSQS